MPSVTFTTRGALRKSALRQANERLILNAIRQNPSISRSDLVRITGLSTSSISFIVNRLKQARMVVEQTVETHAHVGRKPTALRLAEGARMAISVEIALAGSRVALVDMAGGITREEIVQWQPNHEILAQRIHAAIRSMIGRVQARQVLGVGVGLPGTVDRNGGKVIAAENLNWFNVELGALLRGRLQLPFYYENNAKLSAMAERWFSEPGGKSLQDFVFIVPTGGFGTGIITNGHLLQGSAGMAGEFGHTIIHPDGRKCPCRNRGCLEQYASDKALCALYAEEAPNGGSPPPDAPSIVRKAREGDAAALRALEKTAGELALGLVNLVWAFNPEALILGGYLAEGWDLIEETIWQVLRRRLPHYVLAGLRAYPSRHAPDSVLLGGASLVFAHYFTSFEHGEDGGPSRRVLMHAAG